MTDEMSNKQFCRIRGNAQAEAGIEHRKLREEIERLRARERELLDLLQTVRREFPELPQFEDADGNDYEWLALKIDAALPEVDNV